MAEAILEIVVLDMVLFFHLLLRQEEAMAYMEEEGQADRMVLLEVPALTGLGGQLLRQAVVGVGFRQEDSPLC